MRVRWIRAGGLAVGLGCLAALATVSTSTSVRADAREDAVVVRVGEVALTVRDVERRMAQLPPFQLRTFGTTAEEIRKRFVQEVLVRELLFSQGAGQQGVSSRPEVEERTRGILRGTLLARMRVDTAKEQPISDEEVRAYYEQNRPKFNAPARVALWRILVATREEAEKLIGEFRKEELSPKRWNDLARDRSLDKSTSLRGGNLGFVLPDGATSDPEIKVDPRLVQAAEKVKDGELVPEPVAEGERWAVVWRRQSMKAVTRTLEQEAPAIRQVLAHQKAEARVKQLLEQLRKEHLKDYNPESVALLEVSGGGDLQPTRRPGALPSSRKPSAPSPKEQQHQH